MNHAPSFHPHPPHDDADGNPPFDGAVRDEHLVRLAEHLDRVGDRFAAEARTRGVAMHAFNASVGELRGAPATAGRIVWRRWVGAVAAAAVLALAVLVPLGVIDNTDRGSAARDVGPVAYSLPPAGLSERLVLGFYNRDAAFASLDLMSDDDLPSVVMTRGLDDTDAVPFAQAVSTELEDLLAVGGRP